MHPHSLQQVLIFDEREITAGDHSGRLWKKANNLAWAYAFLWLLPYLKQLGGRILGTQLSSMSRPQLRQKQEESTQTYTYKEVRAEAFAPGDDSLVYFQLFVGTQQWGLIQNQSSFLKRVMERTPQPCPLDTQRPQARWPWKQTQSQVKEQLPEESRALQKHLIKFRNGELTGCSAEVEKTTVADSKSTEGTCLAALCRHTVGSSATGKKEQRQRWSSGTARAGCTKVGAAGCSRCQLCWHTIGHANLQGDWCCHTRSEPQTGTMLPFGHHRHS